MFINILRAISSSPPLQETSPPGASDAIVYFVAILGFILSLILIIIINKIFSGLYQPIENWCYSRLRVVRIFSLELILPKGLIEVFVAITKFLRSVAIFIILLTSLIFIFNILPGMRWIPLAVV